MEDKWLDVIYILIFFIVLVQKITSKDKEEELEEIIGKLNGDKECGLAFIKLIPDTLKKLAHKNHLTYLE